MNPPQSKLAMKPDGVDIPIIDYVTINADFTS